MTTHQTLPITFKIALPFCLLLGVLLVSEVIGIYIGNSFLAHEGFKGYWVLNRTVLPFILIFLLSIPLKSLYLSKPKLSLISPCFIGFCLLGLIGLLVYLQFFAEDYLQYYRNGRSLETLHEINRFQRFVIFTASTIIGWELLYRGFILGGGKYCLVKHLHIETSIAIFIMVIIVCICEVTFHLQKPIFESLGMVIASPLLSYLTIKTRSLWPAMTIHLMIEFIFGFSAYVYSVN
jgi:membrane protease YdiL (CAAX protease family)